MRSLIILLLTVPVFAFSQVNRSARELASEQVQEYINTKLFKGQPYKPVYFGDLKPRKDPNFQIEWTIEHRFEITEAHKDENDKATQPKAYKFLFYLDHKMKVLRAESYFTNWVARFEGFC